MKRAFVSAAAVIILILVSPGINYAQELSHPSFGITAAVNGSQGDLLFSLWPDNYNSIAPSIGLVNVENSYTDLSLGLAYHHYFRYTKNFSPFLGGRAGILLHMPESGTETSDFFAGIGGGGEYFLSSNFSFGVEAQLNFVFSDENSLRFGNPGGTNINTGTVIFASVYF
jgi:hypothetical protein